MTPDPKNLAADLGDIPADVFRKHLHQMADWIADYRERIAERPIAPNAKPGAVLAQLEAAPPETGISFEEIFADVERVIVPGVAHWAHPQFMSYFGCTTTSPGILAEMITAALNVNAMTWRTSPAATELETLVLDWLRQWLGLPDEFSGVVYDTASISTMHALAVAREEASTSVRTLGLSGRSELPIFRIYTSDQAHSSVEKAAIALGLGEHNVRRIASDSEFRLNVTALREALVGDLRHGFKPLAVVATVGTTSTASVDPVREIAAICAQYQMWLHIDAAYGGGLALLPEHKWVTDAWAEADSLVINPHKMLFVPLDFSALYVRDVERLRRLFSLTPEYLHLRDPAGAEINYMDYGVQLGRRFRALKAWVVWRAFGREGIAARIREHVRLAQLFARWIEEDPRFEISAPVQMGVVCFRLKNPDDKAADQENSRTVAKINASGSAYLTQTKLRGRVVMRLGLGNLLTTEEHVRRVWEIIREATPRAVTICLLSALLLFLAGTAAAAKGEVGVDVFVNWDFKNRKKLPGWRASSQAIQQTIDLWYPGKTKRRVVENGTPAEMRQFVSTLPTSGACDTSLVYFASHQSAAGEWHFTQREIVPWESILKKSDKHPNRIVIVDACSAAAAAEFIEWRAFAPFSLFASAIGEDTAMLNFDSPQPIDFQRRFPEVTHWLRANLGSKWEGKLSFLGFVWVKAFLLTPDAPKSRDEWRTFLALCERVALDFRETTNRRFASQVMAVAQP